MMDSLLDYSLEELTKLVSALGEPTYRARQIYNWLMRGADADRMSDVPAKLTKLFCEKYTFQPVLIEREFVSKDKTRKYLFKMADGELVEGVLMNYKYGSTLCVSTQIGCRMNCAFCASSLGGLKRNLSAGEILGQVVAVNAAIGGADGKRRITNLVLMGSGEPLDNYDNVIKFLRLVSSEDGLNISMRNISLSTCGIVPKIYELAELKSGLNLCISLHATTDETRERLIPVAKTYKLRELIEAVKHYFNTTKRRVYFEYILIKGVNMGDDDAVRLAQLVRGMSAHINLIMLNDVKERGLKGCSHKEGEEFLAKLTAQNLSATLRRSMGSDIQGACGQLRSRYVDENKHKI